MALRRSLLVALFLCLLIQPGVSEAATQELLRNGGFDQGTSGWFGTGLSSSGCAPAAGSGALRVSVTGLNPFAAQDLAGPLGNGAYSLSGLVMAAEGYPSVVIGMIWLDKEGRELHRDTTNMAAGESYSSFSLNASRPVAAATLHRHGRPR